MSNILDRISFWSLFLVVVLLPIFFLPFSKIPVETSKSLIFVIGLTVSIIFWTAARFSDGKITLPRSPLMLSGLGIVLAFFLSALFSSASQVSFFGVMFDIGTFWFIFSAFLLMLVSSMVLKNPMNARMVFFGIIASFAVVFVFQALRLFMPQTLSLGVLGAGKTSNILGSWNALGLFAGLVSIMSLFSIEFFSVSKSFKKFLGILILFSILLAIVVNFSLVWKLVGIFALIIFVYKISSGVNNQEGKNSRFPAFSLAVVMISLLFFVAGQFIGGILPSRLGLSNVEISPSFMATMSVSKATLKDHPILGIGPNRFNEAWASYKPASINSTQFWDASFDSGSGLLPTFTSTTGTLGIIAWLVFLSLFVVAGVKALSKSIKNNTNVEMTAFFVMALYLFISAILYSTGTVMFLLAFVFTGVFIGLYSSSHSRGELAVSFLGNPKKSFFSILLLLVVMIVSAALSFKYIERFASVSYFGKTLAAQTVDEASSSINKAISLYSNDLYLRTYAQVYLLKLNSLAAKGDSLSEAEKSDLQASFDKTINGAQLAIVSNKANYLNFRMLGSVYETVGAFGVTGAYDKATEAYQGASVLNPSNPGLKLAEARVSLANGKSKEAKDYANQALTLKQDYIDALVLLSQIAKGEGDHANALSYAEKALALSPTNKDLIQYVNSLKNPSSDSSSNSKSSDTKNN